MHIWVDGQCFQTSSNVRGIGRYVVELLRAIDATGQARLTIGLNGSLREETIGARNYLRRMVPGAEIAIWHGIAPSGEIYQGYANERKADEDILAVHINAIDPDIALSPSPFEGFGDRTSPFIKTTAVKALTACIFHDAIPYRFPDVYLKDDGARRLYMRRFEEIPKFDLVLCNSEFTAAEYRDLYGRTNCAAIGAGLSDDFRKLLAADAEPADASVRRLGRYVLYVGGMDWRKNVPALVAAMARVPECVKGDLSLVLAGDNGEDLVKPLRDQWAKAGLKPKNLVSTGWISDAQLVQLYRHAAVTVQPSLMEGFGLTAVEAMATGCPFLSAKGGAVAEVVANEALLFDPTLPPQLAQLIGRVLRDEAFSKGVIAHGLERSRAFTWDKPATLALQALQGALSAAGRTPRPAAPPARPTGPQRLIMDVSSTAESPVMSGIQRVMHRLSEAMLELNQSDLAQQTTLSYCRDRLGWYALPDLRKGGITLDPRQRLGFGDNDTYFLLDSSWLFTDGQKERLTDALILGQEVVHGIHDLGPLTMSALTDEGMPPAFRRWLEFALGHSTGIICVSRAVAQEVYELLEAIQLPRPMKVGYFNNGANFAEVAPDTSWLSFTRKRPTFLMVGTIEPRKAHCVALEAFQQLWAEGVDANLLIVGNSGWDARLLTERLAHHPDAEQRLFVRRGLNDAQLRGAYQNATALIMSSYMEGFGLPVAEAGSMGCPVILSDLPVFRDVGKAAPAAMFFESGNPSALAACVRRALETGFDPAQKVEAAWPTWLESAKTIKQILFGGDWYRHYEPKEILPNTRMSDIGKVLVTEPLAPADRAHSLRYVEGPLVSDSGTELRFVIALRNNGTQIWSSYIDPNENIEVNLGSHIYGPDGICLNYDNPRTSLPFVVYPGQEVYLPVRVSTDWLAKNARSVGIELVQENVAWFGEDLRLDLLQPPMQPTDLPDGSVSDLRPILLRDPFSVTNTDEQNFLFVCLNTSHHSIRLADDTGQLKLRATLVDAQGETVAVVWIANHFTQIASGSYGLMCLFAPGAAVKAAATLSLTFDGAEPATWTLDLASRTLTRVGPVRPEATAIAPEMDAAKATPEPAAKTEATAVPAKSVFLPDDYKAQPDAEFCITMYTQILKKSPDDAGLQFYTWALKSGLLTRVNAVRKVLADGKLEQNWDVQTAETTDDHITLQIEHGATQQDVINKIEKHFGLAVPESLKADWLAGNMAQDDFTEHLRHSMGPYFSRIRLVMASAPRAPEKVFAKRPKKTD